MKIIIGLGNPGKQYENTVHNIGFMAIDALAKLFDIKLSKKGYKAIYGEGKVSGEKIMLVKPQTYMNLSGECVLNLKQKFKDAQILVICDDIDLEKGTLRYRQRGSGGTHNGMRNIVQNIGEDFERIRLGVGKGQGELIDFVLSKLDNQVKDKLLLAVQEKVQQWIQ